MPEATPVALDAALHRLTHPAVNVMPLQPALGSILLNGVFEKQTLSGGLM